MNLRDALKDITKVDTQYAEICIVRQVTDEMKKFNICTVEPVSRADYNELIANTDNFIYGVRYSPSETASILNIKVNDLVVVLFLDKSNGYIISQSATSKIALTTDTGKVVDITAKEDAYGGISINYSIESLKGLSVVFPSSNGVSFKGNGYKLETDYKNFTRAIGGNLIDLSDKLRIVVNPSTKILIGKNKNKIVNSKTDALKVLPEDKIKEQRYEDAYIWLFNLSKQLMLDIFPGGAVSNIDSRLKEGTDKSIKLGEESDFKDLVSNTIIFYKTNRLGLREASKLLKFILVLYKDLNNVISKTLPGNSDAAVYSVYQEFYNLVVNNINNTEPFYLDVYKIYVFVYRNSDKVSYFLPTIIELLEYFDSLNNIDAIKYYKNERDAIFKIIDKGNITITENKDKKNIEEFVKEEIKIANSTFELDITLNSLLTKVTDLLTKMDSKLESDMLNLNSLLPATTPPIPFVSQYLIESANIKLAINSIKTDIDNLLE